MLRLVRCGMMVRCAAPKSLTVPMGTMKNMPIEREKFSEQVARKELAEEARYIREMEEDIARAEKVAKSRDGVKKPKKEKVEEPTQSMIFYLLSFNCSL
jgi:hypothetical protein